MEHFSFAMNLLCGGSETSAPIRRLNNCFILFDLLFAMERDVATMIAVLSGSQSRLDAPSGADMYI